MTSAPRRAFLSFCKLCGWSHTGEEACKARKIDSPSPALPAETAPDCAENLFTEAPAFGPPVGVVGYFNPARPAFEQGVQINEATSNECESFFHIEGSQRAPARYFQLSGREDALVLCEFCMPRDLGPPKKSEPPTKPPPADVDRAELKLVVKVQPDSDLFTIRLDPDMSDEDNAEYAQDQLRQQGLGGARVTVTSPKKASHFIRALADEMVPPIRSGTYAELERHDHKRMRAEIEAIIRWLDREEER